MRLKYKLGIFISFLSVLLMSYNTSAFSMVMDYDNYESISYSVRSNVDCNINGNLVTNQGYCTTSDQTGNFSLIRLVTSSQFSVKAGDIVNFKVVVFSPHNFAFDYGTSYVNNQVQSGRVIGFNEVLNDDITNFYHLDIDDTSPYYGDITGGNYISRVYEYFVRVSTGSDTYQVGLSSSSNSYPIMAWHTNSVTDVLYFKIVDINVFRYKGNDVNAEQEQKTQEAADESESEAENNSENQQTDNIIGVFGSFVSALSSLQPTNCNVTLQWPASLGGNMTVNVCQNKDKAGSIISVFGSITLLVFYLPLALKLLSMIYNEIRSFTSG